MICFSSIRHCLNLHLISLFFKKVSYIKKLRGELSPRDARSLELANFLLEGGAKIRSIFESSK